MNDFNGTPCLSRDEHMRPGTDMATLGKLKPAFEAMAAKGGFGDIVRHRYPQVNRLNHVHTAGNSSGVVDGAAAMLIGSPALGKEARSEAARAIRQFCDGRLRALPDADGAWRSGAQVPSRAPG